MGDMNNGYHSALLPLNAWCLCPSSRIQVLEHCDRGPDFLQAVTGGHLGSTDGSQHGRLQLQGQGK